MFKAAAIGGFLTLYFFEDIQSLVTDFWTWEPGAEYEDGVLTAGSLIKLLKMMKKNLKFELTEHNERFIKERTKLDSEEYEKAVEAYREGVGLLKEKVLADSLKAFRVSKEAFVRSIQGANDEIVVKLLGSLQEMKVRSRELTSGMDQLNVILMSKEYIDLMQESLNLKAKYSDRFRVLDQLKGSFGLSELELSRAFKLHKGFLAIHEMEKAVNALETQFEGL